jgi:MiaB/RimO family radical SAM methylthiotransferase
MAVPSRGTLSGNSSGEKAIDSLRDRHVFVETYGCRYNFGDTAKLVEVLKQNGNAIVGSEDLADTIIINTCTVVGPTERRMLRRLSQFRDRNLYVTGCMPVVQLEAIRAVCSPVVIPPESIHEKYRNVRTVPDGPLGIVQIARGCSGTCTYCITRAARGSLNSCPEQEIHDEVLAFVQKSTPEIQLTAQDVSSYGRDTGRSLPELLHRIGDLPGHYMLRVGMMNPATVRRDLDRLIEAFGSDHIFKFIHLPVQSGSDPVLGRMGRGYSVADFEEIVAAFRETYPEMTLMTDMIVGFCGETGEEFGESLALIERIRPNKVNVTRYSRRPFTPLAPEKDFPDSVKKDRSRIMNARAEKIYTEINTPLIGTTVPFVVTEIIRPGSVMGRSPAYLGIVINEDLPAGSEGYARLKKDRKYFFIGECVA